MFLKDVFPNSKTKYEHVIAKYYLETVPVGLRMRDSVTMLCIDCKHTFSQNANNIFTKGIISCKCSKSYRKTEEELLTSTINHCHSEGLSFKGIEYIRPLTKSVVSFTCNICQITLNKTYEQMIHNGIGCTVCSKKYRPDTYEYEIKIKQHLGDGFELTEALTDKVCNNSIISVKCLTCDKITKKSVSAVIYHKPSCQCLAAFGFDTSKVGYLYLISLRDSENIFYKIGITGKLERRFKELSRYNDKKLEVIMTWTYPPNSLILQHEQVLKDYFGLGRLSEEEKPFQDGYTECITEQSLPVVISIQNLQYRSLNSGFAS